MSTKQTVRYRLRNWPQYTQALVQRGSLTVWFDEAVVAQWYSEVETGKRGSPQTYSDMAIGCALTLRTVFKLPLRATQGCHR